MNLIGNSDPDTLTDFSTGGGREIMPDGRMFSGLNECIISSEMAELNGISVGDTIVTTSVFEPVKTFELIVVGIYSDETEAYPSPAYQEANFFPVQSAQRDRRRGNKDQIEKFTVLGNGGQDTVCTGPKRLYTYQRNTSRS